jgi:hypothetical protein
MRIGATQSSHQLIHVGVERSVPNIEPVAARKAPPERGRLEGDKAGPTGVENLAAWVSRASSGERSNRLHWAACRVGEMAKHHKVSEDAAGRRLVTAAIVAGLTSLEAARTVDCGFRKSGLRYQP